MYTVAFCHCSWQLTKRPTRVVAMASIVVVPYWFQHFLLLANNVMLLLFCVIDNSFNKLINHFNLICLLSAVDTLSAQQQIKRTDCCEGWYCQLRWSVLLLHGTMVLLFHEDQFGQSNLRGKIWSLSHPVINNISCCMVQPCRRCLSWYDTKGLWSTHLLWWQSQSDQLHCRCYGAFAMVRDCDSAQSI